MSFDPGPLAEVRVIEDEHGYTLVFSVDLPHSREKVWRALTEPDHLAAWAPFLASRDLSSPGDAVLTMVDGENRQPSSATVLRAEPPDVLEYTWGEDLLRWQLEASPTGTRLTLAHRHADRDWLPKVAAGWHLCLRVATRLLDGDPIPPIRGGDALNFGWEELVTRYAKRLDQ